MKKRIDLWLHSGSDLKKLIMKLKITFLIFLLSASGVLANSSNNGIAANSPDTKKPAEGKVIDEIGNQSEFKVSFDSKQIDFDSTVIDMKELTSGDNPGEEPGSDTLRTESDLQQQTLKGKVVDAQTGSSMTGVNVVIKGTTSGAITDENGEFTLNLTDRNAVLEVSFIGYRVQDVPLSGQSTIEIKLAPSTTALDEVVVVGYGTVKKATITGSISSVKGEALKLSPATNFSNSIGGRVPGLVAVTPSGEPGRDGTTLRIRGSNTLGDNSPLIVVDGIPNRTMDRLNPADIESVTVLKDASAAIYGAQSANGVILITTKRGTEGKPVVTFNFNQGWSMPTVIPECTDAATYATMLNEINFYNGVAPLYTEDQIQQYRDGTDLWRYPNTDWFGTTFKSAASQNYANFEVKGGSKTMKYFVSVGTKYQDGIYKNSATYFSQSNFRSNIDGKISDYIDLSIDISGRQENRNYPTVSTSSIFGMMLRGKPNMPAYWPNGLNGPDIEYGQNPVVITTDQTGYDKDIRYILETAMKLNITIPWVKGLSVSGSGSYDKNLRNDKLWETPWYLYSWDGVSLDADGNPLLSKGKKGLSDPQLTQTYEDATRITLNAIGNYNFSIFGNNNFKIMAGVERIPGYSMNFSAFRKYFTSTAIDELFAGGSLDKTNNGSSGQSARLNYFGRFNYDYAGKYLLEFVWRYDGSYIFPADSRFGFFPGISAGWKVSDENFWKNNLKFINYFKLRGSWGQTGNDRITPYQYLSSYGFNSTTAGINVFNDNVEKKILSELRIANPNVTWEVANQTNFGLDGQLFDGTLSFSGDYFYNVRSNILVARNASVPASAGLTLPMENIGEVVNQGFELQFGYSNKIGDFFYTVDLNGGYQKNEIKYWDETPGIPEYQKSTGYPMNTSLYYKAIGIFNDQSEVDGYPHWAGARPGDVIFEDVNGDEKIDGLDRIRVYRTNLPTFTGGLTFDLRFKNFYANLFFQGATGAMRNSYYEMQGEAGNYLVDDAEGRWTVDNPNGNKPRTWNRYNEYWRNYANTYWLQTTDYLRLKNVEIGYNLGNLNSSKYVLSGVRVYFSGLNLLTFDNLKDFDPESTSGTSYPLNKVYNIGIALTF